MNTLWEIVKNKTGNKTIKYATNANKKQTKKGNKTFIVKIKWQTNNSNTGLKSISTKKIKR